MSRSALDPEAIVVREYRPEDAEDLLQVRNAIFPPLTLEQWRATTQNFTASLAYAGDEPIGAIPFELRDFLVAPGKVVRVAQENAVGVREDARSLGIGTKMIEAAAEFLPDRCDLLTVYRGAERSRGYKFYERSGHDDLIYLRHAYWDEPAGERGDVAVLGLEELEADGDRLLEVFAATYGGIAGYPPRSVGYWAPQLRGHIYVVLPTDVYYLRWPAEGQPEAYLLLGHRHERPHEQNNPLSILEFAATSPEAARRVLTAAGALAAEQGRTVQVYVSWEYPFRQLLREVGFREDLRHFMIMARVINPQRLLQRAAEDLAALDDLVLDVWTPRTDYRLWEGP
ncbi:MAG: GNAT family N-acetyltransferase, partial [Armatimonadetes bacterium]|nr:GNAT family N-acetyltransferase [Armatimonadota bacterium]